MFGSVTHDTVPSKVMFTYPDTSCCEVFQMFITTCGTYWGRCS